MAKTCTHENCSQEAIALLVMTGNQGNIAQFCLTHQANKKQMEILNTFYARKHANEVQKYCDTIASEQTQNEKSDPIAQAVLQGISKAIVFLNQQRIQQTREESS